jgi:glutaredoxin-related protein
MGDTKTVMYKIRRKDNPELFLKGTPTYLSYDKSGRIFQTLGKLRTFLTNVMSADSSEHRRFKSNINRVADWEVVEIEMVVTEVKQIHEVISPKKLMELLKK